MKVKLNIYILLIVILFILSLIIIKRINTDVMPIMIDYIESNTNSIAEKVLIDAINDVMVDDDIVVVDKNNNNEITTIDFNYVRINKNLSLLTDYILDNVDVLVDGPFMLEKRNLSLKFSGSENQRLLSKEDRNLL